MMTIRPFLPLVTVVCCLAACSGSSSGGAAPPVGPQIAAGVPAGSGLQSIQMTGTWEIRNSQIVDTNSPTPDPAINGTQFVIDSGRVQTIGLLPVNPDQLTLLLGSPPEYYVNQVDGKTIFYGVIVDRRAANDSRLEIAVAGGALDTDTIAVEAYSSAQGPNDLEPIYVVSRYQLARVAQPAPVQLENSDGAGFDDAGTSDAGASGEEAGLSDADAKKAALERLIRSAFGRR